MANRNFPSAVDVQINAQRQAARSGPSSNQFAFDSTTANHFTAINSLVKPVAAQRREDVERYNDQYGTEHVYKGKTAIIGAGEAIIPIVFPFWFVHSPQLFTGGELMEDSPTEPTLFPTVSAVVASWDKDEPDFDARGVQLRTYYRGCDLAVVTTGPATQNMWVHYTFSGLAMTNPIKGLDMIEDVDDFTQEIS